MALRRINPTNHHLPRPFSSSSNPPFPPPPPTPPSDEPDASPRFPPPPPPNQGEAAQKPAISIFHDIRERMRTSLRPAGPAPAPPISVVVEDMKRKLEYFRSVSANASTPPPFSGGGDLLQKLRESIQKIDRQQKKPRQPSIFAGQKRERAGTPQRGSEKEKADAGIMLANKYTPEDLLKNLRKLRPPGAVKDGEERSTDLRFALRSVKEDEDKKPIKSVSEMSGFANLTPGRTKGNA